MGHCFSRSSSSDLVVDEIEHKEIVNNVKTDKKKNAVKSKYELHEDAPDPVADADAGDGGGDDANANDDGGGSDDEGRKEQANNSEDIFAKYRGQQTRLAINMGKGKDPTPSRGGLLIIDKGDLYGAQLEAQLDNAADTTEAEEALEFLRGPEQQDALPGMVVDNEKKKLDDEEFPDF